MPMFRQEDLMTRLCRESGRWLITRRGGDCVWVQANDNRAVCEIMIRDSTNVLSVLFQNWFPVRFSLQNPPSGLFGRLLLRNLELHFAGWAVSIGESCEACLTLAAQVPRSALTASLFDFICREIRDEINGFHQELHDKFLYSMGTPAQPPLPGGARHYGSIGQPVGSPEIRYVENRPPVPALRRPGG